MSNELTQEPVQSKTPEESGASDVIPAFRFSEKKVDSSWKDEARREKERIVTNQPAKPAAANRASPKMDADQQGAACSPAAAPTQNEANEEDAVDEKEEEALSRLFMSLVAGLVQQSLMQLGVMENPFSGRREFDPEGARQSIDLLASLKHKTRGNLNAKEAQMMNESVHDLQFRYVEMVNEMNRQATAQALKKSPGAAKRQ